MRRRWWSEAPRGRILRPPWSIVRRALGGGALGGALLGAGLQVSDVAYRSWDTVGYAAVVGVLVALPVALAAVIVYQAVEARGVRLAWLAGSLTAAVTVVGVAALLGILDVLFTGAFAAAAFLVALTCAPTITRRSRTGWACPRPVIAATFSLPSSAQGADNFSETKPQKRTPTS